MRCAKFVVRKQWFVASSDDMLVRCFNYNTRWPQREEEIEPVRVRRHEMAKSSDPGCFLGLSGMLNKPPRGCVAWLEDL